MSYMAITEAKVTPEYKETAIRNLAQVKQVSLANGACRVRLALMTSGSNPGKLMFFQYFDKYEKKQGHTMPYMKLKSIEEKLTHIV